MQDIRVRTCSATILSLVAFTGIAGATAVLIWWIIFSRPLEVLRRIRMVFPAVLLIGFFGIFLEITGGGGISYAFRMLVIILVGAWMYSRYRPGDFLSMGTWLLGKKNGFDLGMLAEMGMQTLELMNTDFSRIRQAYGIKGTRRGIRTILPVTSILIKSALRRADDTAEIMAVRGYVRGGSYCPVFKTTARDLIGGFAALCMGIIVLIPVSEFFILYH